MLLKPEPTTLEKLAFLSPQQVDSIARQYGTPMFVYSEQRLTQAASRVLAFQAPFGLTARYAMKANPLAAILRLFDSQGVRIDASSEYEVYRAISAGIPPGNIMLTAQQLPSDLKRLTDLGVIFNATSLLQLETYGRVHPGSAASVRFNPGLGSGHAANVETGGPSASFGIWHEEIPTVGALLKEYNLTLDRLHTHIGCGNDPKVWCEAAELTLELVRQFPTVTIVNLGGGFKVARMANETATDLALVSGEISHILIDFATATGRQLHLEIEPGTYLTAGAGTLISRVQDITSTGAHGYTFLKLNTGITEIMRPTRHGSQHPIIVVNDAPVSPQDYVVVGHTCESSDLLTTQPDHPDQPATRRLQAAKVGDLVAIEGAGAYCSAMSTIGYNSFPPAPEVLLTSSGTTKLIKRAQTIDDLTAAEIPV